MEGRAVSFSARKDYSTLCGLDFSDHSSSPPPSSPSPSPPPSSTWWGGRSVMSVVVALLYFCNQRPGIFVAPYLLLRGVSESNIGAVLFVSGMVALTLQTPAGQLVDELHNKTAVLVVGFLATIVGCVLLSNVAYVSVVAVAVTINVVSDVFVYPALYATTLGIFGPEGMENQAPLNETGTHSGNAVFAILACCVVVFATDDASSIFYICVAMRIVGLAIIGRFISSYKVDIKKSRGLVDTQSVMSTCSTKDEEDSVHSKDTFASINLKGMALDTPMNYRTLLTDHHVVVFVVSVMLFHFANAAMLPLLSQQLYLNSNNSTGFSFAAAAVITAQVSMVVAAGIAGRLVPKVGTKPLFITALLAIPIRGILIVLLLQSNIGALDILLLFTQLLDGLAGGIMGLLLVLITENLSRGSGHFAMLLGLAKTAEGIGASFSNLVGETLAEYGGYSSAFLFLSAMSVLPIVIYSLGMPSAEKWQDDAGKLHVQDNLSVASIHGVQSHSSSHSATTREIQMRRSFAHKVESVEKNPLSFTPSE